MKDELRSPAKHQLDHAVPTVIHHPEDDMPVLARWLDRAMQNRSRFWGLIAGLVVVVVGLVVLVNGLELGQSASEEAWTKLEMAKTPSERVELAADYPDTQAERWALLQAAGEYYNQGFADLPSNRDVALATLKKAADLFARVARESPRESPQAPAAALGLAETYEARNELDKAAEQYERVARDWKGSDEARAAERNLKRLREPGASQFYRELYAFKSPEVTLPSGGRAGIPLPPGHPPIEGPGALPLPPPSMIPPPPPTPTSAAEPKATPSDALPADVFAPTTGVPAPEKPKAEPEKKGELPDDVLAPGPGEASPKK